MLKTEYLALSIFVALSLILLSSYFNVAEVINKPLQQTNNALIKKDNNK